MKRRKCVARGVFIGRSRVKKRGITTWMRGAGKRGDNERGMREKEKSR